MKCRLGFSHAKFKLCIDDRMGECDFPNIISKSYYLHTGCPLFYKSILISDLQRNLRNNQKYSTQNLYHIFCIQKKIIFQHNFIINELTNNLNHMADTANEQLIAQLTCYLLDLENIRNSIDQHYPLPHHLQLLREKLNIKISHFQTTINQLRLKDYSAQTIRNMSMYCNKVFSDIVKQSHRLLQIKVIEHGQDKLREKLSVLKEVEIQMQNEWSRDKNTKEKSILKTIGNNLSMLTQQLNQKQLKSMAKEYLHQQFLSIRMAAYKMYQEYTSHSHPSFSRQIKELRKQNQDLFEQAGQLKQLNKRLKDEQKRLQVELNQIKRVNNLISTRYFMSDEQSPLQK